MAAHPVGDRWVHGRGVAWFAGGDACAGETVVRLMVAYPAARVAVGRGLGGVSWRELRAGEGGRVCPKLKNTTQRDLTSPVTFTVEIFPRKRRFSPFSWEYLDSQRCGDPDLLAQGHTDRTGVSLSPINAQ